MKISYRMLLTELSLTTDNVKQLLQEKHYTPKKITNTYCPKNDNSD
jgi:hypothetical protein